MDINTFAEPFLVLFALIALGVLLARLGIIDDEGTKQISALVVNLTLPTTIFLAVSNGLPRDVLASALVVIILGVAAGALTYAIGLAIAKKRGMSPAQRGVYAFAAGCTNTGFLGIPLVGAVLGPDALITAVLYDFSTTINIFTFGVAGLNKAASGSSVRRVVRNLVNPMFLALVFGVAWSLAGLDLPDLIHAILAPIGDTTTPLAMMALGQMLYAGHKQAATSARSLGALLAVRLLLSPALMLGAVWFLPLTSKVKAVCVLQAGMPSAMLTAILARQFQSDHHLGLSAALATTIGSLVTLPALAAILYWAFPSA